jgi:NADPH2:quinone reductase
VSSKVVEVREFGPPEVLRLAPTPEPVPGPDEALVAVVAADVLHIDTMIRSGRAVQWFPVRPPYVPGNGVAGTVTGVGRGVDGSWLGQRVVAHTGAAGGGGGYTELATVPVERLVPVPDEVSLTDAAAVLNDGATALALMAGTGVRPGEWVLILGATGAMGLLLIQLARAAGGHVLAGLRVAGAPRGAAKAEQARTAGAEVVVDYSDPGWPGQVARVTGGAGAAVVLDGVGGALGLAGFGTLADGGRFSGHGAAAGGFAPVDRDQAARRGITVQGIEQAHFPPGGHEKLTAQALDEVAAGRIRPVIGQSYPLERAAEAHRGLEERSALGKTLLMVNEGAV